MRNELYCPLCGCMLGKVNGASICHGCGVEYSNVVVSESIPFDDELASEVSISMECTLAKPKPPERPMPLDADVVIADAITA